MQGVLIFLAILALAATGTVGCGGDDGDSEDEYVELMNEIQREGTAEGDELAADVRQARSPRDLEIALESGIDANEDALDQLRELEPPPEVNEEHERIIDLNEESTALVQDTINALHSGDRGEILAAARRLQLESESMSQELLATLDQINEQLGGS
jgi:hypothetical protein